MNSGDSRLVLRDIPIAPSLFGLIFTGLGILIYRSGGIPIFMPLIFFCVGLFLLLTASVVTITADRITRLFKTESRSIIRHKTAEFPFDDIIGINVERSLSSGKGARYVYRLVLLKKDGQVLSLQQYSSSGWGRKEKRALRLREFLGIQDTNRVPSGVIPMELANYADIRETDGIRWQIQPLYAGGASAPTGTRWHSADYKTNGFFLFLTQKAEGQSSTGFLASLGTMFITTALSAHGFKPEDTPGIGSAITMEPLDPVLESSFLAYTDSPEMARRLLSPELTAKLSQWSSRHALKQFQSNYTQLVVLYGPNGVTAASIHLRESAQVYELITLGVELTKIQKAGRGFSSSSF